MPRNSTHSSGRRAAAAAAGGEERGEGVEEACDALTREEDARAKWLALRAEAKRRRALGLPATTRGIWGF